MRSIGDAATPAELLAGLVAADATRPRLTWYDDTPGLTQGERIELSGRVVANWAAKAAHLLVDDLDVERGDVVVLDLPPHWRAVYWALAAWSAGAVVQLDDTGAAVLVTDLAHTGAVAPQQVAVSLPALARTWTGGSDALAPLPAGAVDEAADLANHPDVFDPFEEPGPDDDALVAPSGRLTAAELLDHARAVAFDAGWTVGERVAVLCPGGAAGADERQLLADVLVTVLAVWSVDGSVVLVRGADPASSDMGDRRLAAERVTSACGPTGRPASRP